MKNYIVLIVKPEFLENELNIKAKKGYELFHVQALQTMKPSLIPGNPSVEIQYQLIMFKNDSELSNQYNS